MDDENNGSPRVMFYATQKVKENINLRAFHELSNTRSKDQTERKECRRIRKALKKDGENRPQSSPQKLTASRLRSMSRSPKGSPPKAGQGNDPQPRADKHLTSTAHGRSSILTEEADKANSSRAGVQEGTTTRGSNLPFSIDNILTRQNVRSPTLLCKSSVISTSNRPGQSLSPETDQHSSPSQGSPLDFSTSCRTDTGGTTAPPGGASLPQIQESDVSFAGQGPSPPKRQSAPSSLNLSSLGFLSTAPPLPLGSAIDPLFYRVPSYFTSGYIYGIPNSSHPFLSVPGLSSSAPGISANYYHPLSGGGHLSSGLSYPLLSSSAGSFPFSPVPVTFRSQVPLADGPQPFGNEHGSSAKRPTRPKEAPRSPSSRKRPRSLGSGHPPVLADSAQQDSDVHALPPVENKADHQKAGKKPKQASKTNVTLDAAAARVRIRFICDLMNRREGGKALDVHSDVQTLLEKSEREDRPITLINEGFAIKDPYWEDPARMVEVRKEQQPGGGPVQKKFYVGETLLTHSDARSAHRSLRRNKKYAPYLCTFCAQRFADATDIARHVRTHTNVQPFKCQEPGCGARFTQNVSLEDHKRKQHGISAPEQRVKTYVCEFTALLFHSKEEFMAHTRNDCRHHLNPEERAKDRRVMPD